MGDLPDALIGAFPLVRHEPGDEQSVMLRGFDFLDASSAPVESSISSYVWRVIQASNRGPCSRN